MLDKETLERARQVKAAFIDIEHQHKRIERGVEKIIPEKWTINGDEKMNLCDWLCENCTQEDFRRFQGIFGLMEEVIGVTPSGALVSDSEVT